MRKNLQYWDTAWTTYLSSLLSLLSSSELCGMTILEAIDAKFLLCSLMVGAQEKFRIDRF